MGITAEYRDQVENVQSSMENKIAGQDALSIKSALDDILPFVILLLAFSVMFSFVVPVSNNLSVWITRANYLVIVYFAARLAVEFKLSNSNHQFVHDHWLDMLMVIPAFSILQEAKFVRLADDLFEEYELLSSSEMMTGSAFRSTGVAARMTKISKIVKRSISF
jgi:hypothetical protein